LRHGRGLGATTGFPESEHKGQKQQSQRQLAPGNLRGRLIGGLAGDSGGISWTETLGWGMGSGPASCGIGQSGNLFRATSWARTCPSIFMVILRLTAVVTIFIAPALFAAIGAGKLVAAIGSSGGGTVSAEILALKIFALEIFALEISALKISALKISALKIVALKILALEIGALEIVAAEIVVMQVTKIRQDGLSLNLALAQCSEVVSYGFFFVESDLAGVGPYETLVEDAAGKLIEVFVFERAQHAGANLRGVGDGIERDVALFTLLAKFFPERTQGQLRRAGLSFRSHQDGNNHRRRRRQMPQRVAGSGLPRV
jgi:hypothetical protein